MDTSELTRRQFLIGMGALTCCCGVMGWPNLSFAKVPTDKRLMVVVLRGAMDGLAAVPPIADKTYHDARGTLALPDTALLNLDGYFAMHSSLKPLHSLYTSKELLLMHATATPYRNRSHFDAQDLLENGTPEARGLKTGWMGRTLEAMGGTAGGLAIGPSIPLLLNGAKHVNSWAPSILPDVDVDFMNRVMHMYAPDAVLADALKETGTVTLSDDMKKAPRNERQFISMMETAAKFMITPDGERLATIDIGGWDTHANQGLDKGRLANVFEILAEGILKYKEGMGEHWKNTAVLVITEFGRTVKANGTGGSDHGTGTVAMLMGGSVNGGRVVGEWPTLGAGKLYEDRDLYPANDLRSLLKGVLQQHYAIEPDITEDIIFPQSKSITPLKGLFSI